MELVSLETDDIPTTRADLISSSGGELAAELGVLQDEGLVLADDEGGAPTLWILDVPRPYGVSVSSPTGQLAESAAVELAVRIATIALAELG